MNQSAADKMISGASKFNFGKIPGLMYETHLNNCNHLIYVSKFIEEFDASNTIYR